MRAADTSSMDEPFLAAEICQVFLESGKDELTTMDIQYRLKEKWGLTGGDCLIYEWSNKCVAIGNTIQDLIQEGLCYRNGSYLVRNFYAASPRSRD